VVTTQILARAKIDLILNGLTLSENVRLPEQSDVLIRNRESVYASNRGKLDRQFIIVSAPIAANEVDDDTDDSAKDDVAEEPAAHSRRKNGRCGLISRVGAGHGQGYLVRHNHFGRRLALMASVRHVVGTARSRGYAHHIS